MNGIVRNGMRQFLGIPYAAPPTGGLRWRPPQPVTPWQAPRDAVAFGNTCAQNTPREGFALPGEHEDCLFLNVFTPAQPGFKRPVMAWVHGGGLFMGSSNDYDPRLLVTRGDVVFVSMNYRLNVFGFFSHPAVNGRRTKRFRVFRDPCDADQLLKTPFLQANQRVTARLQARSAGRIIQLLDSSMRGRHDRYPRTVAAAEGRRQAHRLVVPGQ